MNRVVHFEISANDPEKVIEFYKNVFGWQVNKWDGPEDYWLISTGDDENEPGINGGFFRPNEQFAGTVNTIQVDDLDACLEKVKTHGGQAVTEKMEIPNVGHIIYCKDVEGVVFGLFHPFY